MIYIAVQLIQIFSAGPATGPRGSEVVQEVLADLKSCITDMTKIVEYLRFQTPGITKEGCGGV